MTFRDDALILSCALFVIPRPGCGVKSLLESLVSKMQEGSILYAEAVREFRKVFITSMLERHRGNQSRAARALGVHRNTLSRAMVELGIAARRARPASVHSVKAERRRA